MPLPVEIEEPDLTGFTDHAREQLKLSVKEYALLVITEANRIESGVNETNKNPEVTHQMVRDAVTSIRRGLSSPKKDTKSRLLLIASPVLGLITGGMFNFEKFKEPVYVVVFMVFLAAFVLCLALSALKD